jgi:hypothetical protein
MPSRQGCEETSVVLMLAVKELTSLLDLLEHLLKGPEAVREKPWGPPQTRRSLSATIAEPTPAGFQR